MVAIADVTNSYNEIYVKLNLGAATFQSCSPSRPPSSLNGYGLPDFSVTSPRIPLPSNLLFTPVMQYQKIKSSSSLVSAVLGPGLQLIDTDPIIFLRRVSKGKLNILAALLNQLPPCTAITADFTLS